MKDLHKDRIAIVDLLNALRTCIDRKHYATYKKIIGGLACDTREQFKLSIIAYLLIKYQKDKQTCLDNNSSRPGWKIVNVFVDYVTRECRECLKEYLPNFLGSPNLSSSTPPPIITFHILTSTSDVLITSNGDTLIHQNG
jgi:hypothetical protein